MSLKDHLQRYLAEEHSLELYDLAYGRPMDRDHLHVRQIKYMHKWMYQFHAQKIGDDRGVSHDLQDFIVIDPGKAETIQKAYELFGAEIMTPIPFTELSRVTVAHLLTTSYADLTRQELARYALINQLKEWNNN